MSSKGIPISIAVLHFRVKSDKNLNNSMNIWILNNPQNMGTHLNQREVVMFTCYFSKHKRGCEKNTSNEQNVYSYYLLIHNNQGLFNFLMFGY